MKVNQYLTLVFYTSLLLLYSSLPGYSQENIRFQHISSEEGLSQSTVQCIIKDHQGYMWFGTRDGLNKYDGYKITVYRRDMARKETIGSNFINDLLEDSQGNLWIATSIGLERFDRKKDTFQHFSLGKSATFAMSLLMDTQGQLWIGTLSGLYLFDPLQGKITQVFTHEPTKPGSLANNQIYGLTEDPSGELWIATEGGLERLNPKTLQFTHYRPQPDHPKSLPTEQVRAVFKDSKSNIWVGFRQGGIALYNRKENDFTHFQHNPANANTVAHNDILSFAESWDGKLWIGTENGGISVLNPETKTFTTYKQDILEPTSLRNNSIHALYRDDQGNMWVGTWAGGLSYFARFTEKFTHYKKIPGTNSTNIYAISGDRQGNIWLGLENEGLFRYNPRFHNFLAYKNPNQKKFDTSIILSIKEVNNDTLALACRQGGFVYFTKRNGRFIPFRPDTKHPSNISEGEKNIILIDRDHNIWIGDYAKGLSFYNRQTKAFVNYAASPNDSNAISNGLIRAMCEDKEGDIWIGTEEGGIQVFDRQQQQFHHHPLGRQQLPTNHVLALLQDRKGLWWIGTYGEGVLLFNPKTLTLQAFTTKDGLPSNIVEGLLEDGKGNIWFSTNQGISRFNPQTQTFRNYDTKDGLQANEFNRNACYQDATGFMYFAGNNGFNVFHPDSIQDNPFVPPIVLTDFQIFNQSIKAGDENSPLTTPISETSTITLSYGQSVFSFEFAALDFSFPAKNQYAYQLENFDQQWNPVGHQRKATYTNLDPGEYTFRIKASNNDGVWNEKGLSVKVIITPPFWLTWWFKIGSCICVLLAIGLIYRIKTYRIKTKNKELEARVLERTQKIELQKQELEASQANLEKLNLEISQQNEVLEIKVSERTQDLQAINEELASSEEELRQTLDNTLEINERLEESKASLAEAQRIARFGSWELETATQKVTWSEETLSIFGHERADTTPTYAEIRNRFLPEYREPIRLAIQAAIEQGIAYEEEIRIRNRNGQIRWTLIVGKPVFDSQGTVHKLIGTIVDITERKLAEQQLKHQNQELLKINAELDSFVYRASHDLRAPLSSLLGLINITKTEDNEEMKAQYLQLMEKSVGKLDQFIQGIINYSRNARLEVTRKPIDFQSLIAETLDDLKYMERSEVVQKQLVIEGKHEFFSDLFRLKIVFSNLISNAIRYSNPRVTSFINIHIVVDAQKVRMEFSDNGFGIAQESIGKIFDMFYRASQENVGSGLGLYIVKEVILALDGHIQVQSEMGLGTTFTVTLPNLTSQAAGLPGEPVISQNTNCIS
jgi:PAS domain S-box-containing protein